MFSYLDDAILDGFILESTIATPYSVEENIKRGKMAMQHVISSHKIEPRAMYRKDIGWIGFEWGKPGNPPPDFKNDEEALQWWSSLNDKHATFRQGFGISHIIAKRDWEGKWIKEFQGQRGVDIAHKLVEVIAKGHCENEGQYKLIFFGDYKAVLRRPRGKFKKEKRDEEWLLTGYQIEKAGYNFILESADSMAVKSAPFKNPDRWSSDRFTMPTNPPPFGPRQRMGAANSSEIIDCYYESVNTGWLYDL